MLRPGETPETPSSAPNCDEKPFTRRVMPGQNDDSLRVGICRSSAIPQVAGSVPDGNRRLLNGIEMRTTYPSGVNFPAALHTASKLMSSPEPSLVMPSAWIPIGLEKNM